MKLQGSKALALQVVEMAENDRLGGVIARMPGDALSGTVRKLRMLTASGCAAEREIGQRAVDTLRDMRS